MKLTITRIVGILVAVMIAVFTAWEAAERYLSVADPRASLTLFYLVRGVTTAVMMTALTAWLILRYRRRYEDELRRRSEEAHRMRVFFENIVQDAGDAIVGLDNDGNVRSWNHSAEEIYGYSAGEILGRSYLCLVPQDLVAAGEPERVIEEVRRNGFVRNHETRRVRKDGATITVRLTRSILRDADGGVIGSSAIVRDITAEKQMEARLIEAERMSAIGQLAASTAHEVRNALAGIWGTIEVMQRNPAWRDLPEEIREEVRRQISRIARFVDDLLAYRKHEAATRRCTDLHEILDQVLAAAGAIPEATGKQAHRRYAAGSLCVDVDPGLIEQALQNVIRNAYQAMEEGGTLSVETERTKDYAVIRIADTGRGMTSESLAHAFDPFYTTKPKGAGLGLPIARAIVEAHKGRLDLATSPHAGTTVTLMLPAAAAPVLAEQRPAPHSTAA